MQTLGLWKTDSCKGGKVRHEDQWPVLPNQSPNSQEHRHVKGHNNRSLDGSLFAKNNHLSIHVMDQEVCALKTFLDKQSCLPVTLSR